MSDAPLSLRLRQTLAIDLSRQEWPVSGRKRDTDQDRSNIIATQA